MTLKSWRDDSMDFLRLVTVGGDPWITDAIYYGSRAAVEWMLSRKVDLTVQDTHRHSVVHMALARPRPDRHQILDLLLQHGAPVNIGGFCGFEMPPAHYAVMQDDLEALRMLVAHGADLSIKDGDFGGPRRTPLEYAQAEGSAQIVEFLKHVARDSET